jgi:hypothetical protein
MTGSNRRLPPCKGESDETQGVIEQGLAAIDSLASPSASPCDAENVHDEEWDEWLGMLDAGADLGAGALGAWLARLAESDVDGLATVLRGCLTTDQRRRVVELLTEPDHDAE